MPPIATTLQRHASERTERLTRAATSAAAIDVANGLGPQSPKPTASETRLHGLIDAEQLQAEAEIDQQSDTLTAEQEATRQTKKRAEQGESITDGWAGRRVARVGTIPIALAAIVETALLRSPVATLLGVPEGTLENLGASALAAGIAVGSGARAAEKYQASRPPAAASGAETAQSSTVAERKQARKEAVFNCAVLALIVILASTARITKLFVASQYSGIPVTMGEIAGIVLIQLMFMGFALGSGLWVAERRKDANAQAEGEAVAAIDTHHASLAKLASNFDKVADRHRIAATNARHTTVLQYRSALVDGFVAEQEIATSVAWQHRFASEHNGRRDMPSAPGSTAPNSGPTQTWDGDPTHQTEASGHADGDEQPAAPRTTTGSKATYAATDAHEANDPTVSETSTTNSIDLFAAITEPSNGQI